MDISNYKFNDTINLSNTINNFVPFLKGYANLLYIFNTSENTTGFYNVKVGENIANLFHFSGPDGFGIEFDERLNFEHFGGLYNLLHNDTLNTLIKKALCDYLDLQNGYFNNINFVLLDLINAEKTNTLLMYFIEYNAMSNTTSTKSFVDFIIEKIEDSNNEFIVNLIEKVEANIVTSVNNSTNETTPQKTTTTNQTDNRTSKSTTTSKNIDSKVYNNATSVTDVVEEPSTDITINQIDKVVNNSNNSNDSTSVYKRSLLENKQQYEIIINDILNTHFSYLFSLNNQIILKKLDVFTDLTKCVEFCLYLFENVFYNFYMKFKDLGYDYK